MKQVNNFVLDVHKRRADENLRELIDYCAKVEATETIKSIRIEKKDQMKCFNCISDRRFDRCIFFWLTTDVIKCK